MDDGNDITECYSDETIGPYSLGIRDLGRFYYKDAKVLNQFHFNNKKINSNDKRNWI